MTANVSTDFAALTGSTEEAKIIGDAQKRNVISAKTERSELKRRGILGPDFREEDDWRESTLDFTGIENGRRTRFYEIKFQGSQHCVEEL